MAHPPRKEAQEELQKMMADSKQKLATLLSTPDPMPDSAPPMSMTQETDYEEDEEEEEGYRQPTGESGKSGENKVLEMDLEPEPELEDIVGPGYNYKFRPAVVQFWVEKVIKNALNDQVYVAEEVKELTSQISRDILSSLHLLRFPKYKMIVTVVIAERSNDALVSAYRCLWDAEADCSTSYTYTNDTMYCIGVVHGVYCY